MTLGTRVVALFAVALMVVSAAAPAAALGGGLNFTDDGNAPNPEIASDVTVSEYDVEWGNSLQYEDDSGTVQDLPAELNRSTDVDDIGTGHVNPFTYTATDINTSEFGEFPRKSEDDNAASALDASEWTTDASGTAGSGSVSDVNTAPGVDAVEVSTSSQTSGDTFIATYDNFSVTSDVEKRYVQLGADVDTLESGATVEIRAVDSDGDYVDINASTAANQSADATLANQTGEGHVSQQQIGSLTVEGSGDGTMSEIQKIEVRVSDANADIDFALINTEKMGTYDFGTERVDTDDDDDFETRDITEPHGEISVYSMDTLGSTFDDASIMGVTFPATFNAENLDDSDVQSDFGDAASYPGFDALADIYYRLALPDAYDLSYSSPVLQTTTNWPGDRYVTVELIEDAGEDDFSDLEGWDDQTSTHDSEDSDVTLDSTVQTGTDYVLHYELKLTSGEASAMQATAGGSGGGIFGGSGDGGIFGFILSPLGAGLTLIGGLFARAKGWLPF